MLRNLTDLERYTVRATDGDVGSVANFLLDDEHWVVRYLVVKAGGFLSGRQVLISPISFRQVEWPTRLFHLSLTMDKVKNSPSIDTDLPVSRRLERDFYRYYTYPYYWASSGIWGAGAHPNSLVEGGWSAEPEQVDEPPPDAHLRSAKEVTGYHIHGSDGLIGRVAGFIVNDETWQVRYLVVDTAHWWSGGREVLVSPQWATAVSWVDREVHVDLTRQAIKDSPKWDAEAVLKGEYEAQLERHYGRPVHQDAGHVLKDEGHFRQDAGSSAPIDSHLAE
jgi:hypothetical protein